ncbi:MAG: glycosyltransferase family 4 protein [Planctomycetaceae bacterium]
MHIALITAGGAGMFCGSCMHDNTLARALVGLGHEVSLIPCYTPLRLDERDVSLHRVFLGGVNMYLDALVPFWSRLPRWSVRWLDSPAVLRLVSRVAVSSNARDLGKLTVSLLAGAHGPQREEIDELVAFISRELKPDCVCFSNALMSGALAPLKRAFCGPVFCLLQGDDIFLDDLPAPYRGQALELISQQARQFDGCLVHSVYYRSFMSEYLKLPAGRFHVVPLGIDLAGHDGQPKPRAGDPFVVGFFARICPEKGLHRLLEAFRILHARQPATRLVAGGYLGARDRKYFRQLAASAGDLGDAFHYAGSPHTLEEKVALLKSFDVLSVPTEYREPKGLYVLESLANGVPVVQPAHGAFPEMLQATGGGLLVPPGDAGALARALEKLVLAPQECFTLAQRGHAGIRLNFGAEAMAEATARVFVAAGQQIVAAAC